MSRQIPNKAFAAKAIDRIQRLSIEDRFCAMISEWLRGLDLIAWDDERALFWVKHPFDGWQVAVWLMPVASKFEPTGAT